MKTLYWIDDTHDEGKPPNEHARKRLERGLKVKLQIEAVNDREQFSKLLPTIDETNTCGVVMDYQLTKVGEKGQMAFGTTWASEIRAAHPTIPIIGISHERQGDIPQFRLASFLAFFQREQLMGPNPPFEDISALLSGYSQVCDALRNQDNQSGVDLMVRLINPPATVADLIRAVIPPALRGQWDEESPHVAGRWMWHAFQGLPGFLLDELGLATHLGLNLNGLLRVCSKFDPARYRGAFASDGRPRWWLGAIREIFDKIVGAPIVGQVSHARQDLLKAARVKFAERGALLSHAYGRKDSGEIPDCVAYSDDLREEGNRVQVLCEDTYVDDRDANPAFGFEARRIFSRRKQK